MPRRRWRSGDGAGGDAGPSPHACDSRILRTEAGVYARGTGAPHAVARLRAHRYLRGKGRFARRASFAVRVRVSSAGRFARRLDDRLARGRWRVTASYLSSAAGDGGARLIVRGGRSV